MSEPRHRVSTALDAWTAEIGKAMLEAEFAPVDDIAAAGAPLGAASGHLLAEVSAAMVDVGAQFVCTAGERLNGHVDPAAARSLVLRVIANVHAEVMLRLTLEADELAAVQ